MRIFFNLFLKPFSRSMDLVCCQAGQKRNDRVDVQMSEGHVRKETPLIHLHALFHVPTTRWQFCYQHELKTDSPKPFIFSFDLFFKRNIWINDGWSASKWNSVWKWSWQKWIFILSSYLISCFFVFLSLFMPSIQWLVLATKRDEMNKNTKNFVWFCQTQLLYM